jgi:hypothetical protein
MNHYIEMNGSSGLFTCNLDKVYKLEGNWQVSLVQIDIPKEWIIDIEHRPKDKPEYKQQDDKNQYHEIKRKILQTTGRDHEKNKTELVNFLGSIKMKLPTFNLNSEMENIINFISSDMITMLEALTENRENNFATFTPIIQELQEIKQKYKSTFISVKDGSTFEAMSGHDMYYNNIKIADGSKRILATPLLVNIDLINSDTCLRSITSTQHDYNNLQFHSVTKNYFDSVRVEIQEPIKRTLRIENSPVYLRLQLRKVK